MQAGQKKVLKIVGIVFLVSILLFGIIYGIIAGLKKEKIYINAFADKVITEVETKTDIFTNSSVASVKFEEEIAFITNVNNAINLKYKYYLPYFSKIGLDSAERRFVNKQVKEITKQAESLTAYYDSMSSLYTSEINSATQSSIQNLFYQNYILAYKNLTESKLKLVNKLEEVALEHKIVNPLYVTNVFESLEVVLNISFKINFDQLINSKHKDYSLANTINFLEQMSSFSSYLTGVLVRPSNYENMLINHRTTNAALQSDYAEFEIALDNLSDEQMASVRIAGNSGYTTATSDSQLIIVYNFLKSNGTYNLATAISNDNAIVVGISLDNDVEGGE